MNNFEFAQDPFQLNYNRETPRKLVIFGNELEPGFHALRRWRHGFAEPDRYDIALDINGFIIPERSGVSAFLVDDINDINDDPEAEEFAIMWQLRISTPFPNELRVRFNAADNQVQHVNIQPTFNIGITFERFVKLTPEEEQRRRLRRERNKVAASKCRMKRKEHVNTLRKAAEELESANSQLEAEIAYLTAE